MVCCFCWFALFDVTDQSFLSSCLTMTTLAQLHDCHSCNDERSIVQKKKDRRREAIGFEIPVTRGAFDHGERSTDDTEYHKTINNTGRNVL